MKKAQHYPGLSITESEAKGTVESKLRKQQLTKPMTDSEMKAFCVAMVKNLELKSDGALTDVRAWAESWQAQWFRKT